MGFDEWIAELLWFIEDIVRYMFMFTGILSIILILSTSLDLGGQRLFMLYVRYFALKCYHAHKCHCFNNFIHREEHENIIQIIRDENRPQTPNKAARPRKELEGDLAKCDKAFKELKLECDFLESRFRVAQARVDFCNQEHLVFRDFAAATEQNLRKISTLERENTDLRRRYEAVRNKRETRPLRDDQVANLPEINEDLRQEITELKEDLEQEKFRAKNDPALANARAEITRLEKLLVDLDRGTKDELIREGTKCKGDTSRLETEKTATQDALTHYEKPCKEISDENEITQLRKQVGDLTVDLKAAQERHNRELDERIFHENRSQTWKHMYATCVIEVNRENKRRKKAEEEAGEYRNRVHTFLKSANEFSASYLNYRKRFDEIVIRINDAGGRVVDVNDIQLKALEEEIKFLKNQLANCEIAQQIARQMALNETALDLKRWIEASRVALLAVGYHKEQIDMAGLTPPSFEGLIVHAMEEFRDHLQQLENSPDVQEWTDAVRKTILEIGYKEEQINPANLKPTDFERGMRTKIRDLLKQIGSQVSNTLLQEVQNARETQEPAMQDVLLHVEESLTEAEQNVTKLWADLAILQAWKAAKSCQCGVGCDCRVDSDLCADHNDDCNDQDQYPSAESQLSPVDPEVIRTVYNDLAVLARRFIKFISGTAHTLDSRFILPEWFSELVEPHDRSDATINDINNLTKLVESLGSFVQNANWPGARANWQPSSSNSIRARVGRDLRDLVEELSRATSQAHAVAQKSSPLREEDVKLRSYRQRPSDPTEETTPVRERLRAPYGPQWPSEPGPSVSPFIERTLSPDPQPTGPAPSPPVTSMRGRRGFALNSENLGQNCPPPKPSNTDTPEENYQPNQYRGRGGKFAPRARAEAQNTGFPSAPTDRRGNQPESRLSLRKGDFKVRG